MEYYAHYQYFTKPKNKVEYFAISLLKSMDKDVVTDKEREEDEKYFRLIIAGELEHNKRVKEVHISSYKSLDNYILSTDHARVVYYPIVKKDRF